MEDDEAECAKAALTIRSSSAFCLRPCSSSAAARRSLCDMAVAGEVDIAIVSVLLCYVNGAVVLGVSKANPAIVALESCDRAESTDDARQSRWRWFLR